MGLPIHKQILSWIRCYWWYGFAFLLTILFVGSFILGIAYNTKFILLERITFSADIIGLLALWGLSFQKRVFQQIFWKVFIFIHILLNILCMIFGQKYEISLLFGIIIYSITAVVYIPYYIGLVIYAFRSKQIWDRVEHRLVFKLCTTFFLVVLLLLCLTFIPLFISNNRIIYPSANPPEMFEHMLKYRRTTIPELQEFEKLFPNYLCEFAYDHDPFDEPNLPFKWSLVAGLNEHYLFIMDIKIVPAFINPETEEILSPGSHEQPTFTLYEVYGDVSAPLSFFHPRHAWASYGSIKTLDANEWGYLVETHGDFTGINIDLKKNEPILNFELAFRNNDLNSQSH